MSFPQNPLLPRHGFFKATVNELTRDGERHDGITVDLHLLIDDKSFTLFCSRDYRSIQHVIDSARSDPDNLRIERWQDLEGCTVYVDVDCYRPPYTPSPTSRVVRFVDKKAFELSTPFDAAHRQKVLANCGYPLYDYSQLEARLTQPQAVTLHEFETDGRRTRIKWWAPSGAEIDATFEAKCYCLLGAISRDRRVIICEAAGMLAGIICRDCGKPSAFERHSFGPQTQKEYYDSMRVHAVTPTGRTPHDLPYILDYKTTNPSWKALPFQGAVKLRIAEVDKKLSRADRLCLFMTFEVLDSEAAGCRIKHAFPIEGTDKDNKPNIRRLYDLLAACDVPIPHAAQVFEPKRIVGLSCYAEVVDDFYEGKRHSRINRFYSAQALEHIPEQRRRRPNAQPAPSTPASEAIRRTAERVTEKALEDIYRMNYDVLDRTADAAAEKPWQVVDKAHEEVAARALFLRLLAPHETRRADDIEANEGRLYRRMRFVDASKKHRFLDEGETVKYGDFFIAAANALGHDCPDGRPPIRWANGYKVPAGKSERFLRGINLEDQHPIPSGRETTDPNKRHRLAQIELGLDVKLDIEPEKPKTPYEPQIQVQDIVADDV